jgi:hypothetical protein
MGMTINGTFTFGKSLIANLPAVTIAISKAVVDKTYFIWLDINKLQAAFPKNVQALGDTVTLQGPVMIVSPMSLTRRIFMQSILGTAAGIVYYIAFFKERSRLVEGTPATPILSKRNEKIVYTALLALTYGVVAFYLQPGVYFFKQPAFQVLDYGI